MQKKIIALAIAAAFAAPAVAMADVSVYGAFDAGLRSKQLIGANNTTTTSATTGVTSSSAGGVSTASMDMRGLYNSNLWGIKSTEDLGDGMKAIVVMEADFVPNQTNAAGTWNGMLFDRELSAALAGSFGQVKLGYMYNVAFTSNKTYDPMEFHFVTSLYSAQAQLKGATAPRDFIAQYSNKFGDIAVTAQYIMNNQDTASNTVASSGQGKAVGVDYASGPISVGGTYATAESDRVSAGTNEKTNITLGAGFNYGDGNVKAGYARNTTAGGTIATATTATTTTMWLGADFNVSPKIKASAAYYKRTANGGAAGEVDLNSADIIAMVAYSLSKNTTAYVGLEKETKDVAGAAVTANAADAQITNSVSAGLAVKF